MSRLTIAVALLALAGVALSQSVPDTWTGSYTLFDSKGVKIEFGNWWHDTPSQRDRFDIVAAIDGSKVSRWNFYKEETQFELNSTVCFTNELTVLFMDPFEWVRVAEDLGNSTADDGSVCEKYQYTDESGNVVYSGCFAYVSATSDTTLAPRVVVDVKADRVWHFQTFEALDAVPEEQFLVPEMCTDDPLEPVPADGRRK
eukprot:TRINITY_DN11954_c0_g1_i1.p1 TRINITY_DN11954_c0_g1~~TRINITY_DN11954_c0_g1_i1.p1  ORF type:complete len:200 (+),score=60.82 TRINITY_DN11954_c0_g1_i1:116-715(+)